MKGVGLVVGMLALLPGITAFAEPAHPADAADDVRRGRSYALLVATDRYDHWSDLENPTRDMWALAGELEEGYGFVVETVENPAGRDIVQKLQEYANRVDLREDDQLLVFFAGHGINDDYQDDDSYLVTRDSDPPQEENFGSYLSFNRILNLTAQIAPRSVLVIADTCFIKGGEPAGTDLAAQPPTELLRRAARFKSRLLLTAGAEELVSDGADGEHSPLTRQLLAGLRSYGGADGVLPLSRLENVYLSRITPQQPQIKRFAGHEPGGTFLFYPRQKLSTAAVEEAPTREFPASTGTASARTSLRHRPGSFSAPQVKSFFRSRRLRDATFNAEGDFPNDLIVKTLGYEEVVLDRASDLVWQISGSARRLTWPEAQAYVHQVNSQGHADFSDWRLPTLEELGSLVEPATNEHGLYIHPAFDPEQEECWTTDFDPESSKRWYVRFNEGHTRSFSRDPRFFVRLVRRNIRGR